MSKSNINQALVLGMAAMLALGIFAIPAAFADHFPDRLQLVSTGATQTEDGGLSFTVQVIRTEIAHHVEEVAEDADDEDLEDVINETAEDVADDEDAIDEIENALNETGATANTTVVANVSEAVTEEYVVDELAENNSDVVEDAAQVIADAIVEEIVNDDVDDSNLEDAIEEVQDIIEEGIGEDEVESTLEDLDSDDVVEAVENEDIDVEQIIDDFFSTVGEATSTQEEAATTSVQFSEILGKLTQLESRVEALEEEATVGTTIEPSGNQTLNGTG